jgi:hypothetical protein
MPKRVEMATRKAVEKNSSIRESVYFHQGRLNPRDGSCVTSIRRTLDPKNRISGQGRADK